MTEKRAIIAGDGGNRGLAAAILDQWLEHRHAVWKFGHMRHAHHISLGNVFKAYVRPPAFGASLRNRYFGGLLPRRDVIRSKNALLIEHIEVEAT